MPFWVKTKSAEDPQGRIITKTKVEGTTDVESEEKTYRGPTTV